MKKNYRLPLLPGMVLRSADLNRDGLVVFSPTEESFMLVDATDTCRICGHPMGVHPYCGRILSANNTPFLRVTCLRVRVQIRGEES